MGILTPQKTAKATNQRFSSSVEAVVKYHHTTTSIPNIFKSTSLLHFVRIVFNGVGVRTRARLFKKRQLCVFWKSSHTYLMLSIYIYQQSHSNIPKTPFYVSCIGRWSENRQVLMTLNYPTPWNWNGSFVRGQGLLAGFGRIDTLDLVTWIFPSLRNLRASYSSVCLSSSSHSASCRARRLEHTALGPWGAAVFWKGQGMVSCFFLSFSLFILLHAILN